VCVQTVQKLKFETFPPDLASLDDHIFGHIKDAVHERQFKNNKVAMDVAHTWHFAQPQTFSACGFRKFLYCSNKHDKKKKVRLL
jgi:hypothetical protein